MDWTSSQLVREMYMGMMWRNNPQWECLNIANKMWFMRGPNNNGFFGLACKKGDPSGTISFGHNSPNLDNSHTCAADFGLICYANATPTQIPHGTWAKLEAYIKCSTTATSRDGIVRWWINGVLAGDYTNMNYCADGLNEWIWTETWDGASAQVAPPFDKSNYIDHLYISIPNCPNGCPVTGNTGGGGTTGTYKPRQVHTKYINLRPGEVAELKHKSKRNFFQIYGVPPICSLSAGTFSQTSQAWELTKAEMDTVKLTCPPEFCGSVSLTVLSLEKKDSLGGAP